MSSFLRLVSHFHPRSSCFIALALTAPCDDPSLPAMRNSTPDLRYSDACRHAREAANMPSSDRAVQRSLRQVMAECRAYLALPDRSIPDSCR